MEESDVQRKSGLQLHLRYANIKLVFLNYIRTHGRGFYVGMAPRAWFSLERLKTITKSCLYSPARIYSKKDMMDMYIQRTHRYTVPF